MQVISKTRLTCSDLSVNGRLTETIFWSEQAFDHSSRARNSLVMRPSLWVALWTYCTVKHKCLNFSVFIGHILLTTSKTHFNKFEKGNHDEFFVEANNIGELKHIRYLGCLVLE